MRRRYERCYTRTRTRVLSIALSLTFATLVIISESNREEYERSFWGLVFWLAPCLLLGIRSFWFAQVCASRDVFCYRGMFRNHVISWSDIDRVELQDGRLSGAGGGDGSVPKYVSLVVSYSRGAGERSFKLGTLRWLGGAPNEEARTVEAWLNEYLNRFGSRADRNR